MTQKDMVKRMDEIEIQLDALDREIDRAERIWDGLKDYCVDTPGFLPVWLTRPYDEQAALIDEYRALSRQYRQA
jgi:hypothetical protein